MQKVSPARHSTVEEYGKEQRNNLLSPFLPSPHPNSPEVSFLFFLEGAVRLLKKTFLILVDIEEEYKKLVLRGGEREDDREGERASENDTRQQ